MYDSTTAHHYAAYRPPLHKTILENILTAKRSRNIGLDIGCGTGHSAFALKEYCDYVVGMDSSLEMVKQAPAHQSVNFVNASGETIPVSDNSIDVVTIAGSLNYMDRNLLANELNRICGRQAEIVVYDFEVDLSNIESRFKPGGQNDSQEYDHQTNLSGYPGLEVLAVGGDEVILELGSSEVTHILLADLSTYRALQKIVGPGDLFESVKSKIATDEPVIKLNVKTCYSLYSLLEKC